MNRSCLPSTFQLFRVLPLVVVALLGGGCGGSGDPVAFQSPTTPGHCSGDEIESGRLTECLVRDYPDATTAAATNAMGYFEKYTIETPFPWTIFNINALPTEGLAPLWAAGVVKTDGRSIEIARQQLALIKNKFQGDIIPIPGTSEFTSNGQIRLAMGYWMAYMETKDKTYLTHADRSAAIVFDAPAVPVVSSFTGKRYELPAYAYAFGPNGAMPSSGRTLDPNQDATLALMAQLLAVTPESEFHGSQAMLAKRDKFIAAALDMMSLPRCVPVADQDNLRSGCDTTYGWFSIYQLAVLNRVLKDLNIEAALRNQYSFYAPITMAGQEQRTFPTQFTGPLKLPRDPLFALAVAHEIGTASERDKFYAQAGNLLAKPPDDPASITEPWVAWVSRSQDQITTALQR